MTQAVPSHKDIDRMHTCRYRSTAHIESPYTGYKYPAHIAPRKMFLNPSLSAENPPFKNKHIFWRIANKWVLSNLIVETRTNYTSTGIRLHQNHINKIAFCFTKNKTPYLKTPESEKGELWIDLWIVVERLNFRRQSPFNTQQCSDTDGKNTTSAAIVWSKGVITLKWTRRAAHVSHEQPAGYISTDT